MSGETLRWGIIGAGKIAHDFIQAMNKAERKHKVFRSIILLTKDLGRCCFGLVERKSPKTD
jgi:predicted dehydrogenase